MLLSGILVDAWYTSCIDRRYYGNSVCGCGLNNGRKRHGASFPVVFFLEANRDDNVAE